MQNVRPFQAALARGLITFALVASAPAPALPRPVARAVLGGSVLLTLPTACAVPEPGDCVSAEIRRRTVLVEMDEGRCSGVLVDARTIRTAGHCVVDDRIKSVRLSDGRKLRANFGWTARYRVNHGEGPMYLDQAEIHADRDLIDLKPIELSDAVPDDDTRDVTAVGYVGGKLERREATVSRVAVRRTGGGLLQVYELVNPKTWVARPGQSGGPVFAARACQLSLVGTMFTVGGGYTYVQNVLPVREPVALGDLSQP